MHTINFVYFCTIGAEISSTHNVITTVAQVVLPLTLPFHSSYYRPYRKSTWSSNPMRSLQFRKFALRSNAICWRNIRSLRVHCPAETNSISRIIHLRAHSRQRHYWKSMDNSCTSMQCFGLHPKLCWKKSKGLLKQNIQMHTERRKKKQRDQRQPWQRTCDSNWKSRTDFKMEPVECSQVSRSVHPFESVGNSSGFTSSSLPFE